MALVGRTGSGKSTVGKLVTGLEAPWSGEVLIDGKPIAEIPRAMLRNSAAVVDQNVVIFEGTIHDNISMWDPTITEEAIVTAAKLACIHDFIVSRQGGYEAKLSEVLQELMNLSPRGIRTHLGLNRPIYARTSAYGHFGRTATNDGGFSWERSDLVEELKRRF